MKPEHTPNSQSFLFNASSSQYFDTPIGCLRFIRREGDEIIGSFRGKEHRVHIADCTPVGKRSWT